MGVGSPSMKRCLSSRRCKECGGEVSAHPPSPSASVDLPHLSRGLGSGSCLLPHILRARGGGRSENRKSPPGNDELGPTGRGTLNHLFGIVPRGARRHEKEFRRTPPFTPTKVVDGIAFRGTGGVVLKVVTSTGLRSTNNSTSQFIGSGHRRRIALPPFTPSPADTGDRYAASKP